MVPLRSTSFDSLMDDFVLLGELANESEEEKEELPKKELLKRVSFFDPKIPLLLSTFPHRIFRHGMNPYDCAVISEMRRGKSKLTKTCYFMDAGLLGVRDRQSADSRISLLSGESLYLADQTMKDLTRWGNDSYLVLDGNPISLGLSEKESQLQLCVNENEQLPIRSLQLVETIQQVAGSVFQSLTHFFNQGPLNDMVYDMMAQVEKRWGAVLIPDNQRMKRVFHFIAEEEKGKSQIRKILITIRGVFNVGSIPDERGERMIESTEGLELGAFYGATVINLANRTGFVRTHIEVYQKNWNIS